MATVLTGSQIPVYRATVLAYALKLEILGMKKKGPTAYATIKKEFSLRGNRDSVYRQLRAILNGLATPPGPGPADSLGV
jgi:hypothetical protein